MTIEQKGKIFDDFTKGQKCIFCTFEIELLEDIIETADGYAHRECLDEEVAKQSEHSNEKLEI